MGRYYSGDINGKFWFGVQSSDAADRFGVTGTQPEVLQYYFDTGNIPDIEEELNLLKEQLFPYFDRLIADPDDIKWVREESDSPDTIYSNFADYLLGKQILDCVKKQGYCEFEAEL